jgi:transposase
MLSFSINEDAKREDIRMRNSDVLDIREVIRQLRSGRSERAVAQAMRIGRNTVQKYKAWAAGHGWLEAEASLPELQELQAHLGEVHTGRGPQNIAKAEPYREQIVALRAQGMEVEAIRQRLKEQHGFKCSYGAMWRFVSKLEAREPEVTVRVETAPGEEAQVDFGFAGGMYDPVRKAVRKAWFFAMTLSWSRHQFVRFVFDQRVETWLDLHRRGFEFFGGVVERIKLDNLKAAVIHASVEDPQVQRAYRECAEHYGFLISPCRPATPRHKGKVENGVHYVERNFLAGRDYTQPHCNIQQANQEVLVWVNETAGRRLHGTTHQPPLERFESVEKAALKPIPARPYELAVWTTLKLHRDCYIVFEKAFYSAPYRYVGQSLAVRATGTTVQLYTAARHELIATHSRASQAGERCTNPTHLPSYKLCGLSAPTLSTCRERAAQIGPYVQRVIDELLADSVVDKRRTAERLLGLVERHGAEALSQACQRAWESGDPSPEGVRNWLKIVEDEVLQAGRAQSASAVWSNSFTPATMTAPPVFARSVQELLPAIAFELSATPLSGSAEVLPCN